MTLGTIRVRLTFWYLLVFVPLLIAFSTYVYSQLAGDLRGQFDTALLRLGESAANYFKVLAQDKGPSRAADTIVQELRSAEPIPALRVRNVTLAVVSGDQLLAISNHDAMYSISSSRVLLSLRTGMQNVFATDEVAQRRLVAIPVRFGSVNYTIVALETIQRLQANLRFVRNLILFGIPATVFCAAIGGLLISKKSLEPVVTICGQAERISVHNLNERLAIKNPTDEMGHLAGVFNALLSRLDDSFRIMREFMAEASHELRTPLAIIHGEADVSLSQVRSDSEYRESLDIIRDQSKRMTRIVSDMLALARADAGRQLIHLDELYLNDLLEECCHALKKVAASKNVRLEIDSPEDCPFLGDEELLKRMIVNLLDNAIRYTEPGGYVVIRLTSDPSGVKISVSDTGIGIASSDFERIFQRFHRIDASAYADQCSGLGLAIVKMACEAHHGSVTVSSQPGRGSIFTISLPHQEPRGSQRTLSSSPIS